MWGLVPVGEILAGRAEMNGGGEGEAPLRLLRFETGTVKDQEMNAENTGLLGDKLLI